MASGDLAWFFQQLSLLTQAGLPLPESLAQLAAGVRARPLRRALTGLAEGTQAGAPLAELMDRYPKVFTPVQRQLVAVGEQSGTLPATLAQVARLALSEQQTIRKLREILIYPVVSGLLGCWIIYYLLTGPVPMLASLNSLNILMSSTHWQDRLGIQLMALGTWLSQYASFAFGLLLAASLAVLMLSVPAAFTDRLLVRWLGRLPGFRGLTECWDWARVLGLLGILLGRGLPLDQTLRQAAAFCASAQVRRQLDEVAGRCGKGLPLPQAWQATDGLNPLIAVTLAQTPEAQMPQALNEWAEHLAEEADDRRVTILGLVTAISFVALALLVMLCLSMLLLSFSHATGLLENPA